MSYSSCYILILAVTVAGHDLQINILLNVLFTEKLKNSVIIDILDCQKTGSWIRNFLRQKVPSDNDEANNKITNLIHLLWRR